MAPMSSCLTILRAVSETKTLGDTGTKVDASSALINGTQPQDRHDRPCWSLGGLQAIGEDFYWILEDQG